MKKLILTLALGVLSASTNAASVAWKVTGAAATSGYDVYLLTSLSDSYADAAAIAADSIANGKITKVGMSYGTGNLTTKDPAVTKDSMGDAFLVLIGDNESYTYQSVNWSSYVYDPDNQEASPGIASAKAADILSGGTKKSFGGTPGPDVPEPTSGLLLLVGMAGLALRRKQK